MLCRQAVSFLAAFGRLWHPTGTRKQNVTAVQCLLCTQTHSLAELLHVWRPEDPCLCRRYGVFLTLATTLAITLCEVTLPRTELFW